LSFQGILLGLAELFGLITQNDDLRNPSQGNSLTMERLREAARSDGWMHSTQFPFIEAVPRSPAKE
jgi:hypothetical protein